MTRRSSTQSAIGNLIFTPTKRSRNKPKPIPTASEVKSYDPHIRYWLNAGCALKRGLNMALKRDKFDDVFSQLVRERTNWECDYCGRTFHHEHAKLHCSHFKSRRHKSTRYHPFNAFAHCIGCHRKLGEDPYEFTAHAEIVYGEMTIERVARLSCAPVRLKPWQMDELYQHMKSELKRLRELRAAGEIGRIEFTLLDWYQEGIVFRMGEAI